MNQATSFKRISITESKQLQDESNAVMADIRDPQSYENGHIPDSVHITNDNLAEFIANADKERPLVVVCYHGNSSQQAAQFFAGEGFNDVYSMDGGFEAWKLQYPVA